MDVAGEQVPRRLGGRGHQLELGQVRPMILAMPALHEALGLDRVIAAGGRTIQANTSDRHLIHLAGRLPQVTFQSRPVGIMEATQNNAQAIIGEFRRAEGLPDDGLQSTLMALGPVLDADLAVVGLGENESHPDAGKPAVGDPLVQVVTAEGTFQRFW